MTPKGQAATQDEQPLQISGWMKTLLNSVWMMAPVGHACWQGAVTQCLQTSLIMSQRPAPGPPGSTSRESLAAGAPSPPRPPSPTSGGEGGEREEAAAGPLPSFFLPSPPEEGEGP